MVDRDVLICAVIILVLVIVIGWWVLGAYTFVQPSPSRPDANFYKLKDAYLSYPTELWFRNNKKVYDRELKGSCFRFVILESDGRVVYNSMPRYRGKRFTSPYLIPSTVEYQRASVTLEGAVLRGKTANLCIAAKEGSRYRLVHISSYQLDESDREY